MSASSCPVTGCGRTKGAAHLLCSRHWFMVPTARRNEIWRLYRQEAGSVAHLRVCAEAIADVERLEADRAGFRKARA